MTALTYVFLKDSHINHTSTLTRMFTVDSDICHRLHCIDGGRCQHKTCSDIDLWGLMVHINKVNM